jgi:hypothetical protein
VIANELHLRREPGPVAGKPHRTATDGHGGRTCGEPSVQRMLRASSISYIPTPGYGQSSPQDIKMPVAPISVLHRPRVASASTATERADGADEWIDVVRP